MESKESIPEKSVSFFDIDDYEKPSVFEMAFYRITYRIKNFFYDIKYGFQKLIRPYHASDLDLWKMVF